MAEEVFRDYWPWPTSKDQQLAGKEMSCFGPPIYLQILLLESTYIPSCFINIRAAHKGQIMHFK